MRLDKLKLLLPVVQLDATFTSRTGRRMYISLFVVDSIYRFPSKRRRTRLKSSRDSNTHEKFASIVPESPRAIRSLSAANEITRPSLRDSVTVYFTLDRGQTPRDRKDTIFFRKLGSRSSRYSARDPITGFAACFHHSLGLFPSSHSPLFSDRLVLYLHRTSGCNYLTQRARRPFLADEKCARAGGCAA